MDRQINIKRECKAIIENNIEDSILFYLQEFPEDRDEFCRELLIAFVLTLRQIRKEIEEAEDDI